MLNALDLLKEDGYVLKISCILSDAYSDVYSKKVGHDAYVEVRKRGTQHTPNDLSDEVVVSLRVDGKEHCFKHLTFREFVVMTKSHESALMLDYLWMQEVSHENS